MHPTAQRPAPKLAYRIADRIADRIAHRLTQLRASAVRAAACALIALASSGMAHALDSACKPVVAASLKRIDATAFHQRQEMPGFVHELLKSDGKLYVRDNGGKWEPSPISAADVRNAAASAERELLGCDRAGSEAVDGMPTDIYRFKTRGLDGKPVDARVWIGTADGLPYREESPGVKGTTRYRDVPRQR